MTDTSTAPEPLDARFTEVAPGDEAVHALAHLVARNLNGNRPLDRAQAQAVTREAAKRMTYTQYTFAEAERKRLTRAGTDRDLTEEEIHRLRHAQNAVVAYLDYMFGPDDSPVVYAKNIDPQSRRAARERSRAGRMGRLVYRR